MSRHSLGRSGGDKKHWLFDPRTVEDSDLVPHFVHTDKYFEGTPDSDSTLAIVLDRLLDELPAELEEAVRLIYLSGLSQHKAGGMMGVTHKTAKARADRGIAKIRQRLTDSVWLADLLRGFVPEDEVPTTALATSERITTVLGALKNRKAS
jgi:DNA-directed RNA polymerase specialized sigma24 family protein